MHKYATKIKLKCQNLSKMLFCYKKKKNSKIFTVKAVVVRLIFQNMQIQQVPNAIYYNNTFVVNIEK